MDSALFMIGALILYPIYSRIPDLQTNFAYLIVTGRRYACFGGVSQPDSRQRSALKVERGIVAERPCDDRV
jgi:hypothetical protein